MDAKKVGQFIKELRTKNNLTQKELADKYYVTYQAVSKWENGINLPDVMLIKQMSKDFNISVDDILNGKVNKKSNIIIYIVLFLVIVGIIFSIVVFFNRNKSFEFKKITSTCENFKITGSAAYSKDKTSIYISSIDYCGSDENTIYDSIRYSLYLDGGSYKSLISDGDIMNNTNIVNYLKNAIINFDTSSCLELDNNKLLLEITTNKNGEDNVHQMYLDLEDNC